MHSQGKHKEAEPLCKEVLAGFFAAVGPEHPFTISACENLSAVLRKNGKDAEADETLAKFAIKRPLADISEDGPTSAQPDGPQNAVDVD